MTIRKQTTMLAVDWPAVVVVVAGLVSGSWIASLLLTRVDGLSAPPYDLAFFQQIVWNVGTSGQWISSFHVGSFLGLHFSPLLVVPALIERFVWSDVRVLTGFHIVALGVLVPAAFLFVRAVLRPSRHAGVVAAGLVLGIPAWGAMQGVIRSDFHPELAGVVLALLAGWAGLTGRSRAMWLFAILALLTREDVAYAVGTVGLVVAVRDHGHARPQGRALAIFATIWAIVVFGAVMPWIRGGADSDTAGYYAWLGGGLGVLAAPFTKTGLVVAAITRPAPWFVLLGMVGALATLPLLRPRWLLLSLPPFLAILLSSHYEQADFLLQYPLIVVVPLIAAAGMGGRRALVITHWIGRRRRSLRRLGMARHSASPGRRLLAPLIPVVILILVALPALADSLLQGSLPPIDRRDSAFLPRPASIGRLLRVAAFVPAEASLIVDEGLLAPLAGRTRIGRLGAPPSPEAYVLIDRMAWSPNGPVADMHAETIKSMADGLRSVVADDGRFILWGPRPATAAP